MSPDTGPNRLSRASMNDDGDGNAEISWSNFVSPSPYLGAEGSLLSAHMPMVTIPAPETSPPFANLSLKVHGAAGVTGPEPAG